MVIKTGVKNSLEEKQIKTLQNNYKRTNMT